MARDKEKLRYSSGAELGSYFSYIYTTAVETVEGINGLIVAGYHVPMGPFPRLIDRKWSLEAGT